MKNSFPIMWSIDDSGSQGKHNQAMAKKLPLQFQMKRSISNKKLKNKLAPGWLKVVMILLVSYLHAALEKYQVTVPDNK